ncbi:MAG: response regulator transcription factor [Gemmatimonadetes bacterium]|nr:response regulator transcription factor [Gemmatimonadota bacterium]
MKRSSGSVIRVALLDDHTLFRDGLRRLFDTEPDIDLVAEAKSSSDLFPLLEREQPDLLLLDLNLQNESGLDILPQLAEKHPEMRVLVLTASIDQEDRINSIKLGAKGVVLKYAASENLIKSIRKVAEGEMWVDHETTKKLFEELADKRGPKAESPVDLLTDREREVTALVGEGMRNKEIADRLFISERTVKTHISNIFQKLDLSDRLELALFAIKQGLAKQH